MVYLGVSLRDASVGHRGIGGRLLFVAYGQGPQGRVPQFSRVLTLLQFQVSSTTAHRQVIR